MIESLLSDHEPKREYMKGYNAGLRSALFVIDAAMEAEAEVRRKLEGK
jgi:hypothetical protein